MPIDRSKPILRTEGLGKRYGQASALHDLNITVHEGEVFGYIGPNGAGKTTTFRILCGLLDPSDGRAEIAGQDVTGDRDLIKRLVGFLPDNFGVYPSLRVWEYLDFFCAAYKIPKKERAERIERCLTIANSLEFKDKLMGALSRGMKQRVGIAKTLVHDPKVLILDEPAATVDPRARVLMRRLMRDLADLGKAVLVSSHILPELADVCDTVGILKGGKLIACGPVQQILRTVRQRRVVEVGVLGSADPVRRLLKAAPGDWSEVALDAKATYGVTSQNGHASETIRFEVTADEHQLVQTLNMLVGKGIQVTNYYEVPADLEDVFMTLTR